MSWLTNKKTGGVFNTKWADKDRQIAQNREQANIASGKLYNPIDLRAENLRGDYQNSKDSQKLYSFTEKYIKNHEQEIKELNVNDLDAVNSKVSQICNLETRGNKNPACYRSAGVVAAILDYKQIPYNCYNGSAHDITSNLEHDIRIVNHTWVKTERNIYQTFPNHNLDNIMIDSIIKEVKFNGNKRT